MSQPEASNEANPQTYLSLKAGKASKTGQRSHGQIHYRILTDSQQKSLFITITSNDGGGYFSKEVVPFDKVERCLQGLTPDKPLSAKIFQPAFIGQSSNNAGFLAAILRAEHLLMPVADSQHQHALQPDWAEWKTNVLALADKAEPFQPEVPKPRIGKAPVNKTPSSDNEQSDTLEPDSKASTRPEPEEPEPETTESTMTDEPEDASMIPTQSTNQYDAEADDESIATVLHKSAAKKQRTEKRQHPTGQ